VFLGLLVVFLPLDVESPWITKVCGSLQLFAGLLLLLIAYVGGLREDMFGPGRVKEVGSKGPNVIEWKGGDTSWDTTSLPKRGGGNPWRKEGSTEEGPSSSEPHQMERGTLNLPSSSGAHDLEGSLEPPPGRGINHSSRQCKARVSEGECGYLLYHRLVVLTMFVKQRSPRSLWGPKQGGVDKHRDCFFFSFSFSSQGISLTGGKLKLQTRRGFCPASI